MKNALQITIILGLLPVVIFASEQRVNCDDLARHIKNELTQEEYSDRRFLGACYHQNELSYSYRINGRTKIQYRTVGCKRAGRDGESNALIILPHRIILFEKYQNALKRCIATSDTPSSLAAQTIKDLQKKTEMSSECIALYKEGEAEALREHKEKTAKRDALEKYIHDSNKK